MARGARGRGRRGRGRGRGLVEEPVASEVQSSARGPAAGQQSVHDGQAASVTASVGAIVGPVGAGLGPVGAGLGPVGAGLGPVEAGGAGGVGPAVGAVATAGVTQAKDDLLADLLSQLLERLPGSVPVQTPELPRVAEVQPRAAVAEEVPSYIRMMEQMQRIGTGSFAGSVRPEEADEWRMRVERNFRSIRCPEGYKVDLAVHYLDGDAHLWWRSVAARRAGTAMSWSDFVTEFNSKFFPQEALDRLEARFLDLTQGTRSVREYDVEFNRLLGYAGRSFEDEQAQVRRFLRGLRPDLRTRCRGIRFASRVELVEVAAQIEEDLREQAAIVIPAVQPRRPQQQQVQQAGPGKGGKPAQGQKRKWEGASGSVQSGRGCFVCGSLDHRKANCPKQSEFRGVRTCYQCGEPGHFRLNCPKLQQMAVAVVQPIAQYGGVQPVAQIAAMERPPAIAAPGEPSSRPITGNF